MFLRIYNLSADCLTRSNNNEYVDTFETTAVEDQLKERIAQHHVEAREVKNWKVLDRNDIVRIRA